eukprot:719360-Amphidinium_carterae.1
MVKALVVFCLIYQAYTLRAVGSCSCMFDQIVHHAKSVNEVRLEVLEPTPLSILTCLVRAYYCLVCKLNNMFEYRNLTASLNMNVYEALGQNMVFSILCLPYVAVTYVVCRKPWPRLAWQCWMRARRAGAQGLLLHPDSRERARRSVLPSVLT